MIQHTLKHTQDRDGKIAFKLRPQRGSISHLSSKQQIRDSILAATTTQKFSIFQVCNTNLKVKIK